MSRMIRGAARLAVVAAAAIAILACQAAPSATSPLASQIPPTDRAASSPPLVITPAPSPTQTPLAPSRVAATPAPSSPALTEADGILPERVTVFDDDYPGVANLAPRLIQALREAANDAEQDGIVFRVTSGWRSPGYQAYLFEEAVALYGSPEKAARWVATADKSVHVSGDAVDIAPPRARKWLSENGAEYGLCQIYRNEPWHFELRVKAVDERCPRMYANPTQDPRMQ
jgi:hypothetical protein